MRLTNSHSKRIGLLIFALANLVLFQNCGNGVNFGTNAGSPTAQDTTTGLTSGTTPPGGSTPIGSLPICSGVSCSLTPLTAKPAVSTILMALGDEVNNQLVVNQPSAQFIAESVVRYSTPVINPKILLVHDHNSGSESASDYVFTANVLLARYNVTEINETSKGLRASDLAGYDLIWFNNPGYPMGSSATRDALIAFRGGVVLEGDDLSSGNGFSLTELTGLKNIDNGTSVVCDDGIAYDHDNNGGQQYWVNLDPNQLTGAGSTSLQFRYGNDIDNTVPARNDLQVLASAKGGPQSCTKTRPAITRYQK